ncbi:isocitrate lyase/PEP mutase family protein [Nitriliruptor alkaliphilus]|uniref:isocitrate lyase/PEP mutase family protein n=1 Tax=Nitriliruptor alkaliphilus TaxID=427918 RepID=UPI0006972CCF|nr:isocitrate lyase/phosphoenolpyruvate mutase family protein [Nitriliruptor alkaliphilus]
MSAPRRFRALHDDGFFVMPNAWDVGSATQLAALGPPALATTSSGHAASLGRRDQEVTFDELVTHVAALVAAVDVPVSVDSEHLFAATDGEIRANVRALADLGAGGISIEDHVPDRGGIIPLDEARRRVAAAADAAAESGLVVTARAENHLYGRDDLADTLTRLLAYRDAGADVLYAPGLVDAEEVRRVVETVEAPVNVLLLPGGPGPSELAALGVRRASTGGRLAHVAYDAARTAAAALLAPLGRSAG